MSDKEPKSTCLLLTFPAKVVDGRQFKHWELLFDRWCVLAGFKVSLLTQWVLACDRIPAVFSNFNASLDVLNYLLPYHLLLPSKLIYSHFIW